MKAAGRALLLAAFGALLIWGTATVLGVTWTDVEHVGQPRNVLEDGAVNVRIPLPTGPALRRLPAVPVTTSGDYGFMFPGEDDEGPVRYDPCRPVAWVLNPAGMPEGGETMVIAAVASVSHATGLEFRFDGTTTEAPSFDRQLFQDRYGPQFAPVIVGFATEHQVPDLAGSVTGLGGSSAVYGAYGEQRFLHSGVVIMDADDLVRLQETPFGALVAQAVIEHELGHVVGLGHVRDETELMHDSNLRITEWGPGDLAGLAIAGSGPCEDS